MGTSGNSRVTRGGKRHREKQGRLGSRNATHDEHSACGLDHLLLRAQTLASSLAAQGRLPTGFGISNLPCCTTAWAPGSVVSHGRCVTFAHKLLLLVLRELG